MDTHSPGCQIIKKVHILGIVLDLVPWLAGPAPHQLLHGQSRAQKFILYQQSLLVDLRKPQRLLFSRTGFYSTEQGMLFDRIVAKTKLEIRVDGESRRGTDPNQSLAFLYSLLNNPDPWSPCPSSLSFWCPARILAQLELLPDLTNSNGTLLWSFYEQVSLHQGPRCSQRQDIGRR